MPLPPAFEAHLVRARALTPTVRELLFERVDGLPMVFEPGQWVNLYVPTVDLGATAPDAPVALKRSYSIASPPDGSSRFEIAVTRVQHGPVSTWVHAVEPGGPPFRFVGPQGFFTRAAVGGPASLMI